MPLCPKKGNNRSLLEECTLAHINAIQEPLLKPCLLDKVQANPDVVAALKEKGFTSAEQALTGRTARVQGRSIQTSDVALCSNGVNNFVGEIRWFALVGSDLVVGVSTWPLLRTCGMYRKVCVQDNVSIVPASWIMQAMIYTPAQVGQVATVIMPTL